MSERWRVALPVAAGLATAAVAFAAVVVATDGEDRPATAPATKASAARRAPATTDSADSGPLVFAQMGCGSCHRLAAAGSRAQLGPDLDERLSAHTRGSLRAKITDPGPASMMPGDFARRMSAGDLRALVDFLLAQRGRSGRSD
jgi:cytochrome c553